MSARTALSTGLPADWIITRGLVTLGHVVCPDAHTAQLLAVFRFGADVTVQPRERAA